MKRLYTLAAAALLGVMSMSAQMYAVGTFASDGSYEEKEMYQVAGNVYDLKDVTIYENALHFGALYFRLPGEGYDFYYYATSTFTVISGVGNSDAMVRSTMVEQAEAKPFRMPAGTYDIRLNLAEGSAGALYLYQAGDMPEWGSEQKVLYAFGSLNKSNYDKLVFYPMTEIPVGSNVWYLDGIEVTTTSNGDHYMQFTFDNSAEGQTYRGQMAGYGAPSLDYKVRYANLTNPEAKNDYAEYDKDIEPFSLAVGTYNVVVNLDAGYIQFVGEGGDEPVVTEKVLGDAEGAPMYVYYSSGAGSFYRTAMTAVEGSEGVFESPAINCRDYYLNDGLDRTGALIEFSSEYVTDFDTFDETVKTFYGQPFSEEPTVIYGDRRGNVCEAANCVNCIPFTIDVSWYIARFDLNNLRAYFIKTDEPEDSALGTLSAAPGADAPAVYYTLQGVRVASPVAGQAYVKVQGTKAVKVIL